MAQIAHKGITTILLDRFPEFGTHDEFQWVDLELPYDVWAAFGQYITDYIRRQPSKMLDDDELVNRVFDFANELMDSGDDETQNIVIIELFENFYPYRKTFEVARRKLKPQHMTWLERQGDWLQHSNFHYEAELMAPNGLDGISGSLAHCSWEIKVKRRDTGRARRLECHDDRIDITMEWGDGPRYAFFGDVWQAESEACQLLGELSGQLARIDTAHHIGLYQTYRADSLIEEFSHHWPDGGKAAGV